MTVVKTTLIEGVGWPVFEGLPQRFKPKSKPVRIFKPLKTKMRNQHAQDLDDKFNEWLSKPQPITKRSKEDGRMAK